MTAQAQGLDQRSFALLVDPEREEVLGRAPAGTESAFAAIYTRVDNWRTTATRLEEALKTWDGKSPTIRFLKDENWYNLRNPKGELVRFRNRVYTVLNAVQVPIYLQRILDGCDFIDNWVKRMDRRLIGQDGKSRAEMVDAFQNAQGRILPSEMGGQGVTIKMDNGKPQMSNGKRPLFAPLKPKV